METTEGGLSYEEAKRKRLEENKKRMQELGLADLSKSLKSSFNSDKSPQARQAKSRALKEAFFFEVRRSSRVANNPKPDYREVEADASLGRRSFSRKYSSRSCLFERKYATDEARMDAVNRAEIIMKSLPSCASFVKPMLHSHVTGGFWLGLPVMFCKTYLPKQDDSVVLEDEDGREWETVYLANKTGLSGGWRGFSLDHELVDGDSLVFELIEPLRFKVHIIRAYEYRILDEDECTMEEPEKAEVAGKKGEGGIIVRAGRKRKMEDGNKLEKKTTGKSGESGKRSKKRLKMEGEDEGEDEKSATKEEQLATVEESLDVEDTERKSRGEEQVRSSNKRQKKEAMNDIIKISEDSYGEKQQMQIKSAFLAKKLGSIKASKKSVVTFADVISVC